MSCDLIKLQKIIQDLAMSPHTQAISHLCLGPVRTTYSVLCWRKDESREAYHRWQRNHFTKSAGGESGNKSTGSINPASHSCRLFRNHWLWERVFSSLYNSYHPGTHVSYLITTGHKSLLPLPNPLPRGRAMALDPVVSLNLLLNCTRPVRARAKTNQEGSVV